MSKIKDKTAAQTGPALPTAEGDTSTAHSAPVGGVEGGGYGATHRIAGTPERGFYRAGRHWPREGVEVCRDDFTDEQWAYIEEEPLLSVVAI